MLIIKKRLKFVSKIALLFMCVICILSCVCSCNNNDYEEDKSKTPIVWSKAVEIVKNSRATKSTIARDLGLKDPYSPSYGYSDAEQDENGDWIVTLRGSISGYTDDYHDDFETYKFELTAKVSKTGEYIYASATRKY